MPVHESFATYTDTVCDQVRWKRARPRIAQELSDHLCDQSDAYRDAGQTEELAVSEAVRQMGDPISLGADFDRTYRPKTQWGLLLLAAAILLLGFFLRVPLGLNGGEREQMDWLALGLSFAFCTGAYFLDVSFLGRFALPLYGLMTLGAGILCYAPSWIPTFRPGGMNYACLFGFIIDTRHLVLFAPLAFALLLYALRGKSYKGLGLAVLGYLPWCMFLFAIPNVSGWILYSLVAFALLSMAVLRGWFRVRKGPVLLGMTACALSGLGLWIFVFIRHGRLRYILHPELDPNNRGLLGMFVRALLSDTKAIGASAPVRELYPHQEGLGLAHLSNQFGWLPALGVVLLFAIFSIWILRRSFKQSSMQGRLVSLAISLTFALEGAAFVLNNFFLTFSWFNVLPLFAGANDALVLHAMLLGFLLSVFRSEPLLCDRFGAARSELPRRVQWQEGRLIFDFRPKI